MADDSTSAPVQRNAAAASGSQTSTAIDIVHSSMQITVHRLNGQNYLEWSQSVKFAIDGRGKLGFLTGEKKQPKTEEAGYEQWRSKTLLSWHGC